MRAAIYARKSNEQHDVPDEAKSVDRQVAGGRAYIERQQWTLDEAHVYVDDGVSGAVFLGRPEFQRMLRDAEAGAFDVVVLYDLDRFGRNARHTMEALSRLADAGVAVYDYSTGAVIDIESFEGETLTFLKARFAQQYREQVRKHTRDALRRKAEQGYVAGGKVFGYDNLREGKGQVRRVVNAAEAAVVRDIYERTAAGEGARTIAGSLNALGVPAPRAQQGRRSGWSVSTIRAVLERPLYRGEVVYGRTKKAYGRELRQVFRQTTREKGQVPRPEDSWLRLPNETLRIIEPDLAERVDAIRTGRRTRYLAAVAKGGRVPERAHGKYLLSGGLLVCPTCGGHFEARLAPWQGIRGGVYICSTRRRKPGMCSNTLALPLAKTDDDVLSVLEGEVLGTRVIRELLRLVDTSAAQAGTLLRADRDRLRAEIDRLVDAIATGGVPTSVVAPKIREKEAEVARIEARLRQPLPEAPDLDRLRAALEQRTAQWKADLRSEPKVARLVVRRLIGPITLWEDGPVPEHVLRWQAEATADRLLDGLASRTYLVASPAGFEPAFQP